MLDLKENNENEDYDYILNFNSTNGSQQIKIFVTKPINQKYLQRKKNCTQVWRVVSTCRPSPVVCLFEI